MPFPTFTRSVTAIAVLLSCAARADYQTASAPNAAYGWIPEYKKLYARLGLDISSSSSNFANDGALEDLPSSAVLTDTVVWIEPEYGIAQDWSVKLNAGFINRNFDTGLGAAGLTDIRADVKWMVKTLDPIVTLDVILRLPTANSKAFARDEIVLGDGSVDAGFQIHTGHRSGAILLALSPGFLFRSGSYSYAAIGDAAFQVDFTRGYVRVFANGIFSINEMRNLDTRIDKHDALGTGGSYAILSGSPIGLTAGAKIGVKIYNELYLEGGVSHAVVGYRYPNALNISFALFNAFDFFKPLPAKKIRDVPFDSNDASDSEGDNFYKGR